MTVSFFLNAAPIAAAFVFGGLLGVAAMALFSINRRDDR